MHFIADTDTDENCFGIKISALVGFWAHILLKNLISSPVL